ncbi:MAG: carbohydrate kinase family protein [Candidatus Pacebacteria bacterium]|nr:carbohydrate kinase family protein [Candidatus Paceibacterota bacterium]
MKFDIITIGSASRDVFLNSPEFKVASNSEYATGQAMVLPFGSKIEVNKIVFTTGGSGINTAVTFARQGFKTACIAVIGDDLNASSIVEEMAAEGVDTSFFQKHSSGLTAYSTILVQDNGERTILSFKGEGQYFESADVSFDKLESDWLVIGSLGGHYELLEKAVDWASSKNIKIAFNPGTKELPFGLEKLKPILAKCNVVSMNQEEAAQLFGLEIYQKEEIFKEARVINDEIFIMTNGHDGVEVSDGQNIYSAGVPDSPIVERTGAGDAFISGFVAEYYRSGDIPKSIQLATANSSSVVTQYGAKAGILKKGNNGSWPLVEVSKK